MAKSERVELVIVGGSEAERGGPPPSDGGPDDGPAPVWASEDALAAELVRDLGGDWRFATSGDWYHWSGKYWRLEKLRRVWHLSRRVCRRTARLVEDDNKTRAHKISTAAVVHAVVRLAEADPPIATDAVDFDGDIWALNTQSGVVDLRTGQLHPHRRERLMTRICAAAPIANNVKGGGIPHWEQFLRDCTGRDLEFYNYLQRVCGYLLTGSIEEHAIFFLYGPGGTGKSTFQRVLSWLLADYATTAMPDLLAMPKGERHATELATLHGRRLVLAGEIDGSRGWAASKLKALTGGDEISARFMRGNPFTFAPQFKLLLAGNRRPPMLDGDDAMRRRFHVIPFAHKPARVDKDLDGKLRGELPGILAWAVEGEVRRRLAGGLAPPKAIVDATDEYFAAEDVLGRWVGERCLLGPAEFALTRALYLDFRGWAQEVGEWPPLSEKTFALRLAVRPDLRKGRDPQGDRRGWLGIGLRRPAGGLFGDG